MITKDFNFMILDIEGKPYVDSVTGDPLYANKMLAKYLSVNSTTNPQEYYDYAKQLSKTQKVNFSSPKNLDAMKEWLNQIDAPNFIKAQLQDELQGIRKKLEIINDKPTDNKKK